MSSVCRRALVHGAVQGVGFRYHTLDRARALGLVGWVRNLNDGRVEVCAQGSESNVTELMDWLRRGPRTARVERVEVCDAPAQSFATFEIRRGEDRSAG